MKKEAGGPVFPAWKGKTILVVEDEDFNFSYIHELLRRTEAKILRAETGEKALEIAGASEISLVLMDIKLPDKNGYEVTKKLKALYPSIPVVAQTAFAMVNERERCLSAGCDDYISKPFEPRKLISVLVKFL